jgi:AcrR family transcriptional regulator
MAPRSRNTREKLILAGIEEINLHGVTEFSIRRVAMACHVSCAAPYKHFRDKRDFIAAIIEHVNEQWHQRQSEVLAACSEDLHQRIVEVCVQYVAFLMEKPHFRGVLMLKDEQFDNLYHKVRGQMSSTIQQMQGEFFAQVGYDEATIRRKRLLVRSLLFGSVFLFDAGEIEYGPEALEHIRYSIHREFELP